jgi:hypothetical protein
MALHLLASFHFDAASWVKTGFGKLLLATGGFV